MLQSILSQCDFIYKIIVKSVFCAVWRGFICWPRSPCAGWRSWWSKTRLGHLWSFKCRTIKVVLYEFQSPKDDWCHSNVCTVHPFKAGLLSSHWLPLSPWWSMLIVTHCQTGSNIYWPKLSQLSLQSLGATFFSAACSVSVEEKRHELSVCACLYVKLMSAPLKDAMS